MPRKNRQIRTVRRTQMRKPDRWVLRVANAVLTTPGVPSDIAASVAGAEGAK